MNGRDDSGIATLWSIVLMYALLLGTLVSAVIGSIVITRMKAASIADLAAVAAVQEVSCDAAEQLVRANDMELSACSQDGPDVIVAVTAPPPAMLVRLTTMVGGSPPRITVSARAGSV